ncbi:MAG: HNH endonuclease signature motif containing protein [Ornithinimicrobium sp.]
MSPTTEVSSAIASRGCTPEDERDWGAWDSGPGDSDVWDADDFALTAAQWRDVERTAGTVCALAQVDHALARLPLPSGVAEALTAVLTCAVAHAESPVADTQDADSASLLNAAAGVRVVQGFSDSVMVQAAGTLAHRAGTELLSRKHATDPDELSPSARERWRAKTKSAVAHELSVLTGLGVQAAHARVAFALAPPHVVASAREALARGAVGWRGVSEFWQRCRAMDVVDAQTVSERSFGPLLAVAPDAGAEPTSERAESWPEFHRRLSREVTRVEGTDAGAARERRRAAVSTRDVSGQLCDDGLSTFTVSAGTASVVAALERIETVARRARKAGDPRSLGHLRSDSAMALLVHGTLPLADDQLADNRVADNRVADNRVTDYRACDDRVTDYRAGDDRPAQDVGAALLLPMSEEVRRIIHGLPAARVDVIVPLNVLTGEGETSTASVERGSFDESVGEILGHGFLAAEDAREVATLPGSTWHRLLSDPATGHAVERSSTTYRPDRAMREHVRAVDRFCRAPGCLIPAHRCELDHEQPYGTPEGATSTANLNPKHARHHQLKTEKFWSSVMDDTRRVTWTTLFHRTYVTQAHDHRQYGAPSPGQPEPVVHDIDPADIDSADTDLADIDPADTDPAGVYPGGVDPRDIEDSDMRDQLVYAALSSREGQDRWLEGMDDDPEHPDSSYYGRPLAVFHRHDGRRRPGAPPGQPSPAQLLETEFASAFRPPVTSEADVPPF